MEVYTLNRNFLKQDVIEEFQSLIWTERYYGNGEVELTVPLTSDMVQKLQEGTFLYIDKSKKPMIIETVSIEDGKLKVMGISILAWLNNRFIRHDKNHLKTNWKFKNQFPNQILCTIVREMCTDKSAWLYGSKTMGLDSDASKSAPLEKELAIPGLVVPKSENIGKKILTILVNYGPVYDELKRIAEVYKIGMQITLQSSTSSGYSLEFRTYKGVDRTKTQTKNPVRFASNMDSFADLKELRSNAALKTLVYSYASSLQKIDTADANDNPDTWLQTDPGKARRERETGKYTGFDLRAKMILVGDINIKHDLDEEDDSGPESTLAEKRKELVRALNTRAQKELSENKYVQTVDGTVSASNLFQYGVDYNLGDIVEVEGLTGAIEYSRVTEYIRAQDAEGERSYPTVEAVEP